MATPAYNGPTIDRKPTKPMTKKDIAKAKEADKNWGNKHKNTAKK